MRTSDDKQGKIGDDIKYGNDLSPEALSIIEAVLDGAEVGEADTPAGAWYVLPKKPDAPCSRCGGSGERTINRVRGRELSQQKVDCPTCKGTGRMKSVPSDMGNWTPCSTCSGKGYILHKPPDDEPIYCAQKRTCPDCKGSGEV